MTYKVTIKKRHKDIPRGREAEVVVDETYQGGYKATFSDADTKDFDSYTFSWDYMNLHNEYFNIKQVEA